VSGSEISEKAMEILLGSDLLVLVTTTHTPASLFNHSSTPNVNFVRNPTRGTITFTATRAIAPGDELCICYSADESKLWFMPTHGVRTGGESDDEDGAAALARVSLLDDSDDERAESEARARARAERKKGKGKDVRDPTAAAAAAVVAAEDRPSATPTPPPGVLAAAPVPRHRRPVVSADLPPPLHASSSSRHKLSGPVVLTDELVWDQSPGGSAVPENQWGLLKRARGPVEFDEEAEADDSLMSEFRSYCLE
jgi:tRNA-specific adenosine deaminase 3